MADQNQTPPQSNLPLQNPTGPNQTPPIFDPQEKQIIQNLIDQSDKTYANNSQYDLVDVPFHIHNNTDSPRIAFSDLTNRLITVSHVLFGTNGATAANYKIFFIVPVASMFYSVSEVHTTAGTDAGSVTLNIEKLTGTQAPAGGTNLLSSTINLKGTANTVQNGVLKTDKTLLSLKAGDRLAMVLTGTPTALANVLITAQITY